MTMGASKIVYPMMGKSGDAPRFHKIDYAIFYAGGWVQ
jgi:hypothetical protein